jgi:hypothetical protein
MAHEAFQIGDLTSVVGDNQAYDDRRAGYSGIKRLVHRTLPEKSLFGVAGLNFEHIFDGAQDQLSLSGNRTIFFEPRNHPMAFRRLADDEAELHQTPTPTYHLESWSRFSLPTPLGTFSSSFPSTPFFRNTVTAPASPIANVALARKLSRSSALGGPRLRIDSASGTT